MRFPTAILATVTLLVVGFAPTAAADCTNGQTTSTVNCTYFAYGHFTIGLDTIQPVTAPDCLQTQAGMSYACVAVPAAAAGQKFQALFSSLAASGAGREQITFLNAAKLPLGSFSDDGSERVDFCSPIGGNSVPAGTAFAVFSADVGALDVTGTLWIGCN